MSETEAATPPAAAPRAGRAKRGWRVERPKAPAMEPTYTVGEAARAAGVASRTVSKWYDRGLIKGYRLPGSNDRRIFKRSVDQLMARLRRPKAVIVSGRADRVRRIGQACDAAGVEWVDGGTTALLVEAASTGAAAAVVDIETLGRAEAAGLAKSLAANSGTRDAFCLLPDDWAGGPPEPFAGGWPATNFDPAEVARCLKHALTGS